MSRKFVLYILCVVPFLVLSSCGGKMPEADARFIGTIDTGSAASGGTISFRISNGGASIEDLDIIVKDLVCKTMTVGSARDYQAVPNISIAKGVIDATIPAIGRESENYKLGSSPADYPVIESLDTVGHIEGKFSSTKKAIGKITIYMWVVMSDRACELGTFDWSATAQ